MKPTFYEFFAGGGMARAGLGRDWRCLFANDFDDKKVASYRENWGEAEISPGDIHALNAERLPGKADLIWASFPCQDLSLAGLGAGLNGDRSGAFWGLWSLVDGLKAARRHPAIIVLENVPGALTSNGGRDFTEICRALNLLGYIFGALIIDAERFVPQSRARVFLVAARKDHFVDPALASVTKSDAWTSAALSRAHGALPADLKKMWRWWRLPDAPRRNISLRDVIEEQPSGVVWKSDAETRLLIDMMSPAHRAKLDAAKADGQRRVGMIYRRTRPDTDGRRTQRAEIRFDDVAGCLRTPGGGSSRQLVMIVEGARVQSRLLSAREAARLMGLADDYKLPARYNEAYHLVGDGLAVPAVRFLSENLLLPLTGRRASHVAA